MLVAGGQALITADHGNCEQMHDHDWNNPYAHTTEPVPLFYIGDQRKRFRNAPGILADIAPTVLDVMSLPKPPAMTGESR